MASRVVDIDAMEEFRGVHPLPAAAPSAAQTQRPTVSNWSPDDDPRRAALPAPASALVPIDPTGERDNEPDASLPTPKFDWVSKQDRLPSLMAELSQAEQELVWNSCRALTPEEFQVTITTETGKGACIRHVQQTNKSFVCQAFKSVQIRFDVQITPPCFGKHARVSLVSCANDKKVTRANLPPVMSPFQLPSVFFEREYPVSAVPNRKPDFGHKNIPLNDNGYAHYEFYLGVTAKEACHAVGIKTDYHVNFFQLKVEIVDNETIFGLTEPFQVRAADHMKSQNSKNTYAAGGPGL